MNLFSRDVAAAQEQLMDALRAGQRQSPFAQGVQPLMPQQPQQPQGMMPPVFPGMAMPTMAPAMPMMQQPTMPQLMTPQPMAPQPMMAQPMASPIAQQPQQFAKGGLAVKPIWEKPTPEGGKKLSAKKKAAAKRRAKAAGRPYPNAVDNFAVREK